MPIDTEEDIRYADMPLHDLLQNYKVMVLKNGTILLVDKMELVNLNAVIVTDGEIDQGVTPSNHVIVEGTLIRFEHVFPRWGKYPKVALSVAQSDIMHLSVGLNPDLDEDENDH